MRLTNTVEKILQNHPKARDSDRVLFVELMAEYHINLTPAQEDKFLAMPSLESARRIRQKLQEQGKYKASESIKRERDFKRNQMQQTLIEAKPENIEKILEQSWQNDNQRRN